MSYLFTAKQLGTHVIHLLVDTAEILQQDFLLLFFAAEVIEDGQFDVLLFFGLDGLHVEIGLGEEFGRTEIPGIADVDGAVLLHVER